jgi:O-antigen/teichoic acid export membrane protein
VNDPVQIFVGHRWIRIAAMTSIVGLTFLVGRPKPGFIGVLGVAGRLLVWAVYCFCVWKRLDIWKEPK